MKFILLFSTMSIAILSGCKDSTQEKNTFICMCEEEPDLKDSTSVVDKSRFIFLVEAHENPDCCSSPVLSNYKAFKETWKNEAPNHPTVWKLSESSVVEIEASEAQIEFCALEKKIIAYSGIEKFPPRLLDYYPELMK